MGKDECILVFHCALFTLTVCTVLCHLLIIRNRFFQKFYPVMDTNDDLDEDHLTSYDIQLSIQEAIEASKSVFYSER